jgi:hypothetical protein
VERRPRWPRATSIGAETLSADGKAAIVLSLLGIMFTVLARVRLGVGHHPAGRGHGAGTGVVRVACAALLIGFASFALSPSCRRSARSSRGSAGTSRASRSSPRSPRWTASSTLPASSR